MVDDILRIKSPVVQGDSITNVQYHTYTPYTTSYNNNDEIRIAIQAQDLYVLPSQSYIQIDFTVTDIENEKVKAALEAQISNPGLVFCRFHKNVV